MEGAKKAVFALVYFSPHAIMAEDTARILKHLTGITAIDKVTLEQWDATCRGWQHKVCTG
jgi:hypothetical protein